MIRRILTLCWLATMPIRAADDAPSRQALDFLGKVRAGKIDLRSGTDSAISPATLPARLAKIQHRLETLGKDLDGAELKLVEANIQEPLAAVLVEATGGINPRQHSVVAVAMILRNDQWLAAPWPGSFANTGLPYDAGMRQRAAELESWMMRESALRANQLREQADQAMRANITAKLSSEAWSGLEPRQVLDAFLRACSDRDPLMLAALCGGLTEEPAPTWNQTLAAIDELTSPRQSGKFPWRWLASPGVLRLPLQEDEDNDDIRVWTVAVLDPDGTKENPGKPALGIVDLELHNPDGRGWRIQPPDWKNDSEDGVGTTLDDDLLPTLAESLNRNVPVKPEPSPEAATARLISALQSDSLPQVLECLLRPDDPSTMRRAMLASVGIWKRNQTRNDFLQWSEVFCKESADHALLLLHPFSSRNPEEGDLVAFFLVRSSDGWLWSAWPDPAITQTYQAEIMHQRERWQKDWLQQFTKSSTQIDDLPPATPPPDEQSVRKLIADWLGHCQSGDVPKAIGLTAKLGLADSERLLVRHLAQAVQPFHARQPTPELVNITSAGPWSVATLRETDPQGKERSPVLLAMSTPNGPRLLLEFDWFAQPGRSREFLNKTSMGRISKALPQAGEALQSALNGK